MPLELFPYQEVGAEFLARRERAGIFDEMGIGKSATVVRACDLRRAKRGIIVCPAAVRATWLKEFRQFAHVERRIIKGVTIHDFVAWQRGRFDVLVTGYEMMTKWAKHLDDACEILDFIAFDEGHFLKNPETARVKALLGADLQGGIVKWAEQVWWITGTPIPNDPVDSYTFLRFAKVMPLTKGQFTSRYFTSRASTYSTRQKPKPEMTGELRALMENNAIRRTHEMVGNQLPPILLTSVVLEGDTSDILQMLREYPGLDDAILLALEQGSLSFLDAQHIATLRRLIGEAKAIPYAKLLHDELLSGLDKAVVFGIHRKALHDVRDYLTRMGHATVMVTGETRERDREHAVESFQADPKVRVFIGNIRAAGTGLTLTAASALDMLESDWTPAGNAQAIKRVHRLTQTRNVRARFITLADSFDETVNRIVAEKTRDIAAVEGYAMNAAPPVDVQPALV